MPCGVVVVGNFRFYRGRKNQCVTGFGRDTGGPVLGIVPVVVGVGEVGRPGGSRPHFHSRAETILQSLHGEIGVGADGWPSSGWYAENVTDDSADDASRKSCSDPR